MPGGYVGRNETALQAAMRELKEEVNISVSTELLKLALDITHDWEGKRDHVDIFSIELTERPDIKVDNREVIDAGFFTSDDALKLNLFPPLRQHIEIYKSQIT